MTSEEHRSMCKVHWWQQDLLCWQVVEREDEAPVEVSFPGQRVVVDVRLLAVVFQALQPSKGVASENWRSSRCPQTLLDLTLPLDVDVAGLFPRQEAAVLQDDIRRVPDDDSQFVPGVQEPFLI